MSGIRVGIEKAISEAKDGRIRYLEDQILAYKEQQKVDLAVKKDLDEKLDKVTADYRALWVENNRLKDQLANEKSERDNLADIATKLEKKVRDLDERNNNLRERLASTNARLKISIQKEAELRSAIDQAINVSENDFNRGRIKGMEEIWDELRAAYSGRGMGKNQEIFGYGTVGEIVQNLSPTWFINRAEEYHEEEKKIHIGDEVEIFDTSCPDDDQHSDIGIVIAIGEDNPCFTVIGQNFKACLNETDIESGRVKKTGKHFDSVPLDYLA